MRTKAVNVFLVLGAVLSLGVLAIAPMDGAIAKERGEILLRYAAHASPRGTRPKMVQWWASEIEKRTNGKVKIRFFWKDALLKAGDALEGIGKGTADVGTAWGIYHKKKTPLWTVGDPPFSHSDPYAGLRAMQEMFRTFEPLKREIERWNVKFLVPFVTGLSQVGSRKKPILTPGDVKGLKIRYAGGEWAKLWKSYGAVPIKLTYGEVYEALMRGTVDATQAYVWTLQSYKLWDVIRHFTLLNAGEICSYGIVINMDKWKSLPADSQKVILQVSDEFVVNYARALLEGRERVMELAESKGVKFYRLDPAQQARWREKAKLLMEDWVKTMQAQGLPGREAQSKFLALIERFESEIAKKGYPWKR